MTSDSDETLMLALAAGDDLALNGLMDRWQVRLRGFIYRWTRNDADALDLAQETFLRVYQHRKRFRRGARFSTWMFQIALNLARDRARWRRRHPTEPLESMAEPPNPIPQGSPAANPADSALQAEKIAAVKSAIGGLPDELREAVILFEYEEKSHAEIAAIVRATPKAVETRLYRARQILRNSLARYFV